MTKWTLEALRAPHTQRHLDAMGAPAKTLLQRLEDGFDPSDYTVGLRLCEDAAAALKELASHVADMDLDLRHRKELMAKLREMGV